MMPQTPTPIWRVLVAEDDPVARMLLTRLLIKRGHRVTAAEHGAAAVAALKAESFDVAVVDLTMPELDGRGVAAWVRGNESTARLPLVALSAEQDPMEHARALAAGFGRVLVKPVPPGDLMAAIGEAIAEQTKSVYDAPSVPPKPQLRPSDP